MLYPAICFSQGLGGTTAIILAELKRKKKKKEKGPSPLGME